MPVLTTIAAWLIFQTAYAGDASQSAKAQPFASVELCKRWIPRAYAEIAKRRTEAGRRGRYISVQIAPRCVTWEPPYWIAYRNQVVRR